MTTRALRGLVAVAVVGFPGCGGSEQPTAETSSTAAPTETPQLPPVEASPTDVGQSAATAYIGSLAMDADGTLMIGTGLGLFRLADGARTPTRVTGKMATGNGGAGTLSASLELRALGRDRLLASGHPEGGGTLPENLGLIESADHGETWRPVTLLGEADLHIVEGSGDVVVGVQAESADVLVSTDGGRSFQTRSAPKPPIDLVIDPSDPKAMVVSTEEGVFVSADQGRSWRQRDASASAQLAWPKHDLLIQSDAGGGIRASEDGGRSWNDRGRLRLGPTELAADRAGNLYAAVPNATVMRSTDGGSTWRKFTQLR
jgi:hypothetical protein